MAWLTINEFRTLYIAESATEVVDAQLDQCLRSGIRLVTKFVGSASAAEVVADATADNADKRLDLRTAQGKLAYRELLPILSSRFRDGGILDTERDENGNATNKYVSAAEIEKRRSMLYADAMEIIEPYLTPEESEAVAKTFSSSVPIEIDW